MKHTYKIYYFLFLAFLLEIPQTALATCIKGGEKMNNIQPIIDDIPQDINAYVNDTIGTEFTADIQEEVTKPKLGLYPNPSFGLVTLEVKEDLWQGGTVSIYNIIGQLIAQKPIDDDEIDFDLSDRSQGVYLVTLRNGDAQKTLRMVKK